MRKAYDIIIIGTGPAGLACALELANSSLKVLVVEKKKEVGLKLCAGGIRVSDLKELGINNENIASSEIVSIPNYGELIDFTTIDRKLLGQWQLMQIANASNITVLFCANVTDILPNQIVLDVDQKSYTISFGCLIGADGSTSIVRHKLGIQTNNDSLLSFFQYSLPITDATKAYKTIIFFYEPTLFGNWYAYIFPQLKTVNVGCGGSVSFLKQPGVDIKENFKGWLKKMAIDIGSANLQGGLINTDYRGFDFSDSILGKVYLCGDAAGLAFFHSGEGIHQALLSGKEIGKLILNKNYEHEGILDLIEQKKKHVIQADKPIKITLHDNLKSLVIRFINKIRKLTQ